MSFTFCREAEARFALSAYGGLGCEAASSLAMQVSWLIFEPKVSKIAYESTLETEYFHLHNSAQSQVFRS